MPKNKWFQILAKAGIKAEDKTSAEVFIYGDIGESWYGDTVAAKDFVKEFSAIDADEITIRINSIGGSVTDGIAIYNAIKRHAANVTVAIDGLAASIASLIAMAGDKIEIAANAQIMIHAPWMIAGGNSAELRKYADMLDGWAEAMAISYADKSGQTKEEILSLLTDGEDHWYGAEAAKEAGFVDEITNGLAVAASLDMNLVNNRFRSVPDTSVQNNPAAAAAQPKKEGVMPKENEIVAATVPAATEAEIVAKALAADGTRRASISTAFSKFSASEGVQALLTQCQNDTTCTVQAASELLLAHLGKGATPAAGGVVIQTIEDERDRNRLGMTNALLARAGIIKAESNNAFRGFTLFEMARATLERNGVRTNGMGKMEVVAAAFTHTSSDFTSLLGNIAEKAMLKGFEEADETFQSWTNKGSLPDFKAAKRVDLNAFPSLDKVAEGAEYKYATVGDRGEQIVLATYGKLFSITRQAIINDDLDAFTKIPKLMGRAAIRTVGDLVYAILTGNPNMADGTALFHATHGNLPTASVINTASVDAMRVAMGTQKQGKANLNIRLAKLIVPFALEGLAKTVRDSEYQIGGDNNKTAPNSVRNTFDVISDARLDSASAQSWYGTADSATNDTIEVAYLDGQEAPTLEQQNGWGVDGVEFKVRLDAGVKALAWQTLAKNAGA
ncbi:MAG: ClpP-like prohead protease/major capsid protein fusion protein [Methylophilaceae bacterium]